MIDLKYHIASLVAVFLALGIGILVGSTMLGNDTLIDYQKQVTDRLETQLENLRLKNETIQANANNLEMDLNIQKEFNNKVFPVLVNNKLENKNLALIETNGYRFSGDLLDALELSGANVTSVTSFLNFSDAQLKEELAEKLAWNEEDCGPMPSFIAGMVANAVLSGEMKNIDLLAQTNVIQVSGTYGEPLDGVIIVGGCPDEKSFRAKELDQTVIDTFQSQNLPVYGVEDSTAGYSYMEFYQKKHLTATVDNIDTVPGKLALILAIDGYPGHYGIKSSAQRLLPEFKSDQESGK